MDVNLQNLKFYVQYREGVWKMMKIKKKSKVYFQMFLSYLGILVIPMILAMVLYAYTFQIIRSQAEEMNKNLLIMVKNELDYEIENLQKIASRLALDDRVQMAANVKKNFTSQDQMNLYYIYTECLSINMSEDFIEDVFLVFNNTKKVVSINGNMSDQMFYDIYYKSSELSYEQFQEYMNQFHYGDMLPVKLDSGKETFLFTMTTLKPDFRDSSAVVCIAINADTIRKRFQNMRWSDTMDVICLTDSDFRVSAEEEISDFTEWKYELWEQGNHQMANELGDTYMISVLPSEVVNWKYLSVMPLKQMAQGVRRVHVMAIVGLFLCTIVGIFTSYFNTKHNYNPIKMLMENFKQHGKVEIEEGVNEYQWLNSQMDQFFKQHVDAEALLKKNRRSLKNYYLYQLLQEYCDGSLSAQYGLRIHGEYHVVVLLTPVVKREEGRKSSAYLEENALQKFALMNVFEELCSPSFYIDMVELGERVAAIISLPDEKREHIDVVKNQAEILQQMMEESFGFTTTILVGSACTRWEGIHDSYLQALELEQYVRLLDANLILYDDVKDIKPHYQYPFELEQKLINAIKVGDNSLAWATMEQVFDLNLCGNMTTNGYRCLVYGMIGTLLEGASQGEYKEAAKELTFPDKEIMSVGKMKKCFQELTKEICNKIANLQKETAQDQTLSKKVQEYIRENYRDPDLNISITSQHFDLTPAYLSSIYKKQTGGSLLEYINTVRLGCAEQLLEEGYSVVEVAAMSGFRDSSTFIRVFKKKKGMTPGQLKKKK